MTATYDPHQEVATPHLMAPPHANGKAVAPPSLSAGRAGFWRKATSKELRKGRISVEEAWSVYWNDRTDRPPVSELCRSVGLPLQWALWARRMSPTTAELLDRLSDGLSLKQLRKPSRAKERHRLQSALNAWLSAAKRMEARYDFAVGCLAAAYLLGEAGGALEATLGWRLLDFLADAAVHADGWSVDASTPEAVVAQQMLSGELPLTLGYYFREMAPLHDLRRPAVDRLSEGVDELLNGEGLPRAEHLDAMRPLLACWTRCRAISVQSARGHWGKKAQRQYEALVTHSLRWTAADESLALSDTGDAWPTELLQAALRFGGVKKDGSAARALLGRAAMGDAPRKKRGKKPKLSDSCDWACLTLMRSGWHNEDSLVAVNFAAPELRLEAWSHGRKLIAGAWSAESRVDGEIRRPTGSWEELCWFTDKDVDYLELSLQLEGGASLERQVLLAHKDQFLLLADNLKCNVKAELEHAWQVPLGSGLLFCGEGETRDALLVDGMPKARVMPLALPEWRIDPRIGELTFTGAALRLCERMVGRSIACPLFIDLNPERSIEASTWRQLTVAELLKIQPADMAISYRVQAGKDQWVYYRSLGPRGNRSFLGQNTSSEMLLARFRAPSGEIETLIEIEG